MVQVKKHNIRRAILASAFRLFSRQGYHATTLAQIARGADVSPANVYIYFGSKLDVLYALYDPWLRQRITRLEQRLKQLRSPHRRMRALLQALWKDIPAEQNGFANNVMQAVSATTAEEGYDPSLLQWVERKVAELLREALPPERRALLGTPRFSHILMMAFDGFVINYHLRPGRACSERTLELMCRLLRGEFALRRRNAAARPAGVARSSGERRH
jgi:AcrR family transcriptional regulator